MSEPRNLVQKLLDFQKEVGTITKDSNNPFYNSKYFDINKLLEVVKPLLSQHGMVLLQPLVGITNGDKTSPGITTVLLNADNANDQISFTTPITELNDAQKMGGSVTYWRRYAIQSMLGLQADDDDGNSLVGKAPKKKAAAKKQSKSSDDAWSL
jgi:hypothetical protein